MLVVGGVEKTAGKEKGGEEGEEGVTGLEGGGWGEVRGRRRGEAGERGGWRIRVRWKLG